MTPNECLQYYSTLKLHFSSDSYDGVKYNWKLRRPVDYTKRNDKHFFAKLSRHPDPMGLLVASLSFNPNIWIGDLFLHEAQERYHQWKRYQESFSYCFKEDLNKLNTESFRVVDGQHPDALQKYMRGEITLATMATCNRFIKFVDAWDKQLEGDPVWNQYRLGIVRFKPFLTGDKDTTRNLLIDWVVNNKNS